jgi:ribosome-binding protein aMBF1 (putative translation factor)
MALRRVQRKTERTPEQMAELRAVRESFQREQPGQDELVASGDYDGPFRQGDIMTLLSALATLKRERERQGLSLAEISDRSGLDKGMISRLENGKILNPTVNTLWKYANAVGMTVSMSAEKTTATQQY